MSFDPNCCENCIHPDACSAARECFLYGYGDDVDTSASGRAGELEEARGKIILLLRKGIMPLDKATVEAIEDYTRLLCGQSRRNNTP